MPILSPHLSLHDCICHSRSLIVRWCSPGMHNVVFIYMRSELISRHESSLRLVTMVSVWGNGELFGAGWAGVGDFNTPPSSGNTGWELIELWEVWMVPELLEVSELEETNLSSRSFMSGSPGLRAWWRRHFSMELKTSGSSISSESWESSDDSDSTCSTSL